MYAFDSDTGALLWQVSLLAAGETPSDTHGCGQVTPEIGITSTPVIDRNAGAHGTVYVGCDVARMPPRNIISVCTRSILPRERNCWVDPTEISATYRPPAAARRSLSIPANTRSGRRCCWRTARLHELDFALRRPPYSGWIMAYRRAHLRRARTQCRAQQHGAGPAIWMSRRRSGRRFSREISICSPQTAPSRRRWMRTAFPTAGIMATPS